MRSCRERQNKQTMYQKAQKKQGIKHVKYTKQTLKNRNENKQVRLTYKTNHNQDMEK